MFFFGGEIIKAPFTFLITEGQKSVGSTATLNSYSLIKVPIHYKIIKAIKKIPSGILSMFALQKEAAVSNLHLLFLQSCDRNKCIYFVLISNVVGKRVK